MDWHRSISDGNKILMITGTTRVYGIIADPIEHVKTPQALNDVIRRRGVDGVLVPFHIREKHFAAWIEGLRGMENLGGFIVTVPHKTRIVQYCDEVSHRARRIGAANVVRREPDGRLIADMLDGEGFIAGLRRSDIEPSGKAAYMAGAGGAANAIAFALAAAGVARLTIANRTRSKAEELRARLIEHHPGIDVNIGNDNPSGHDLIVNATSLGLRTNDALPLDTTKLPSKAIVAEIIMQPEETRLLAAGRERGCRTHPGLPMLMGQVDLMADFMGIGA